MTTQKFQTISKIIIATILYTIILLMTVTASAQSEQISETSLTVPIIDFQLVAENNGWVWIGRQLFWTSDSGAEWTEITPDNANQIRDIYFIDTQTGFLVSQQLTYKQDIEYTLFITQNQGDTWRESRIVSYPVRDPRAITQNISSFFLNPLSGWVVFQQQTSPNFNIGLIMHTEDGGQSWQPISAPLGNPVQFRNPSVGYMAGGVASANLFQTANSGTTWERNSISNLQLSAIGYPNYLTAQSAYIPAIQSDENGSDLLIYSTLNSGETWTLEQSEKIGDHPEIPGVFLNLPGEIKIITGHQIFTYYLTANQLVSINPSGISNPTKVEFTSNLAGWAISNTTNCLDTESICESTSTLVSTSDSGLTWQPIDTPKILTEQTVITQSDVVALDEVDLLSRTGFLQGQGYDQCEISTLGNLQAWKNNSPLAAVNLYIGGISRGCPNTRLNADTGPAFIEALSIQGWKFIPTWVGPQAACTNYTYTMNLNPDTAYNQGRDQGTDAVRIAQKLGLSAPDESGTVIYYDLEAFNVNDPACLNAAKAFINGWVERLHEAGVTAGVYGSVCASALDEYYTLANPPDVIWPAAWSHSNYYSAITPDGLPCISDSQWGDHQRILQYTGPHIETWGNVAMYVDLNVVDGIVADLSHQVGVPVTSLQNPSFETGSLPDWEVQNDPAECNWQVIQSTEGAHSGDYYFSINRGPSDTNCTGISQTVTHTPLVGDRYRFAIWAKSSSAIGPRNLTLKISGEGAGASVTTQYFSGIEDQWVCLETNYDIPSPNLTAIVPEIELENSDGIDLYLDNANLSVNTGPLCPTIPSPSNLIAKSSPDQTSILLTWDPVPTAAFYEIYRSVFPETTKSYLAQVKTNEYTDAETTYWEEYNYWVRACTPGQCSQFSQIAMGNIISPYLDFFDGFELGDTSKWTSVSQPDLISVCIEGNLYGQYGLCLDTDTVTAGGSLTYDFTVPTREAEIGFTIDPNNFAPGGEVFTIFRFVDTGENLVVAQIMLKEVDGQYRLAASGLDRNGEFTNSGWFVIPNAPTRISLLWTATNGQARTSAPVLSGFTLWINGTQAGQTVLIDNQTLVIDRLTLGGLSSSQSDQSSGIVYIDDFYYQAPLYYRP